MPPMPESENLDALLLEREAMLKRRSAEHGPLNIDTLRYQLREYSPDKAQVGISYNLEDGTYNEWVRDIFREGGQWLLR